MYSRTYRQYVVGLLLLVYIFNQVDRAIFGILMEPIKLEFGLSDTQLGFLAGPALVLFYATLGIPIARWADRSHRVNIMSGAIALWSAIVMLSALVANFWHFVLARIGVGVGEAGFSAVAQSVIADYHAPAQRARAMSIFMLGIPLGVALSNLMGGWINEIYGWRMAFIAAGVPGLLLALLMKWTVSEPPRDALSSVCPQHHGRPSLTAVWRTVWERRSLRHLTIAMALSNLAVVSLVGWLAPFFIRIHDVQTGELGLWLALIMGVGGGLGIWLGGNVLRRLKLEDERQQTIALAVSAAAAWPILLMTLMLPNTVGALLSAFVVTVLLNFFFAPAFALMQGLCAANVRATVLASAIFFQVLLAAVIGLQAIGMLSDALTPASGVDALRWAMIVMSPATAWAALHFSLASRSIREDLRAATASPDLAS